MDDITPEVRSFLSSTAFRGATGARVRSLSFASYSYSKEYLCGQVENLDELNSDEDMSRSHGEGDDHRENEHRREGQDGFESGNDDEDDTGDEMTLDLLQHVPESV